MLDGFTVGITADRRADEQASLFERRDAAVIHGPSIRTLPLGDDDGLRAITEALIADPPHVLVANTGLGIRSWFGAAESWDLGEALLDTLRATRVYARGPKASGAVHSLGLDVVARAPTERLRECVDLAVADLVPGERVVVQRDGGTAPPDVTALEAAGATVIELPVYRWQRTEDPRPAVRLAEGLIAGRVHAVTFTAGPAITSLLELADDEGLADELRETLASGSVVVGCVGPVCAEAAEAAGFGGGDLVVPRTWRLGPLVRSVSERLLERSRQVGDLMITGNVVRSGERRVELTDIEARIMAALTDRPGAVVAKVDLLRDVWGDADADPHVVEVAVGRLRRRLGPDGATIAAVARRGYVLR
ncbi:MAG: uroporphyrinogen-III synthase [Acidimicrobiales bacterium]|nr:uroporphyrinogen-III synthase [Acidimicrobiales bacterium]